MVQVIRVLSFLLFALTAHADIRVTATIIDDDTVGGVNWLESLGYTRPRFINVTVPNEASSPNKYYVNLSSGSGSTCSQASPCAFSGVCGKSTSGGAYIYMKGTARLNITSCTLAGTSGTPIVIKPWPSDSTVSNMTAAGGCAFSDANQISASGMSNVIFDGGPDMLFRFTGSGCTTNQNGYTLVVNSNNITLWRVRINVNGSSGPGLGVATAATTSGFRFINSELYGATRYYGVYTGGGTACPGGTNGHTNLEFRNSIFRGIDGRGIQIEPRASSSGVIVDGCVFHDIGYNRNGASGGISAAVQPAGACGVNISNITISNNIGWDLGGGLIHSNGSHNGLLMYHNTAWDYGNGSPQTSASHAYGCSESGGCPGTARNNIALQPTGVALPFNRAQSWTTNDNLCESGSSNCGSGGISGTNAATTFVSTSTSSASFLFPKGPALGIAILQAGFATDYIGNTRSGAVDAGAIEQ